MSVLRVAGLCKAYPSFRLEEVGFSLREGEITGFIGRNGAGKTTTLKSILGFVHPDRGAVEFFDRPFSGSELQIKQDIGYVSGGFGFYPAKRLKTITAVTRRFYRDWDDAAYRECLRRFQLDERKTPAQLSEGMKVKYALTLALSHRAKLLLLDEPTSGLDPVSRDELLELFLDLQNRGTTILFSTHITSDLDKCADRILYIQKGRILADADCREFVGGYRLVAMERRDPADEPFLIGCKHDKRGDTALIRAEDAPRIHGEVQPTDLETIMVHLERTCAE